MTEESSGLGTVYTCGAAKRYPPVVYHYCIPVRSKLYRCRCYLNLKVSSNSIQDDCNIVYIISSLSSVAISSLSCVLNNYERHWYILMDCLLLQNVMIAPLYCRQTFWHAPLFREVEKLSQVKYVLKQISHIAGTNKSRLTCTRCQVFFWLPRVVGVTVVLPLD